MSKPDDEGRLASWRELADDDDEPQPERQCSTCGAFAPAAPSSHSLISGKHGWRLQRIADEHGVLKMSWLCPSCAAARRARLTGHEREGAAVPSNDDAAQDRVRVGDARARDSSRGDASRPSLDGCLRDGVEHV